MLSTFASVRYSASGKCRCTLTPYPMQHVLQGVFAQ
jgi:hypothetical protein